MESCSEGVLEVATAHKNSDNYEIMVTAEDPIENRPLLLVDFIQNEDGKPMMKLDKNVFKSIINRAGDRPVVVYCTGGLRRECVDIFLDYMVQRLETLEMGENSNSMHFEEPTADWRIFKLLKGFKPGDSGMWIWSRPFIIKNKDGKEIAVLLMDAHGSHEDIDSMSAINALGILTSSVMICNGSPDDFDSFATLFENFTNSGDVSSFTDCVKFPKLVFLIRDWIRPEEYPVGWEGGKRMLEELLKADSKQNATAKLTRDSLAQFLEEMDCFLLPDFGEQARPAHFSAPIDELAPEQSKIVIEFTSRLLIKDNLVTKRILLGHEITARDLLAFLEQYVGILNSEETVTPQILMEATRNTQLSQPVEKASLALNQFIDKKFLSQEMKENICSFLERVSQDVTETQQLMKKGVEKSLEHYGKEMENLFESREFLPQEDLEESHENFQKLAVQQLRKTEKIPDNVIDYKKNLLVSIRQRFEKFKEENSEKETATRGKAQSVIQQCYKTYLKNMRNKIEDWNLKSAEFAKKKFLDQCPAKDVRGFVEEHEKQLDELINATFEKLDQALADVVYTLSEERQNEKAQSLMEECAKAAVAEVGTAFPERIKFWIKNVLDPDSISEMKVIYSEALNGIVEKYRNTVSAKRWAEFVECVNLQCKEGCLKSLEMITKLLENVKECLHAGIGPLYQGLSVTPDKLKEIAKTELQKIGSGQHFKLSVMELEMVQLGFDRLLEIYETRACIKVAAVKIDQLLNIYKEVMENRLEKEIHCSPEAFQKLHDELAIAAIVDFKLFFCVWRKGNIFIENERLLRVELDSAFECHRKKNEKKLENRRAITEKIIGKLKKQYNEAMWQVLIKNPGGLNVADLEKFHTSNHVEIVKLLEMEIRQKIGSGEPTTQYRNVLESHIDLYWLAIVSMNQENLQRFETEKQRETLEILKAKTDLLNKCTSIQNQRHLVPFSELDNIARKLEECKEKANDSSTSFKEIHELIKFVTDFALARGINL